VHKHELAASLRNPAVRQLAVRAAGLSPEALHSLTLVVEHTRRLEGLEGVLRDEDASDNTRVAFRPLRRGRRPIGVGTFSGEIKQPPWV
jgi:hypothetical protein